MCADRGETGSPFITDTGIRPGQVLLDRFEIIEQLGGGGGGEVWLAKDRKLKVERALKVPAYRMRFDRRAVQQLEKEAKLTARLEHPNIVRLHDLLWTPDNYPVLVFDYVPGWQRNGTLIRSLDDWVMASEKIPEAEVRKVLPPVLDALHYAHTFSDAEIKNGLVHLDLKPTNILFDRSGVPRVIDFHIADVLHSTTSRLSGVSAHHGSLPYMSPEQSHGDHSDARSDVYSLGILLYELLTGAPPFTGGDITFQHRNKPVPLVPDASEHMNTLIQKAVAKDPEDRWKTCAEMKAALLGQEGGGARTLSLLLQPQAQTKPKSATVSLDGVGHFRSIKEAVLAVDDGGEVHVLPGHYKESVVITRPVAIVADGARDKTIVESIPSPCFTIQSDAVKIQGFSVRAFGQAEAGIAVDLAYSLLRIAILPQVS